MVLHQNWTRIAFRNEERVIEPRKHVKHDYFGLSPFFKKIIHIR